MHVHRNMADSRSIDRLSRLLVLRICRESFGKVEGAVGRQLCIHIYIYKTDGEDREDRR